MDRGRERGFTCGTPWLAVPANHVRINAEDEVGAAGSMYEFYRELIALRKGSQVLADGTVRFLDTGSGAPKVIAFERVLGSERVVAICSFDSEGCGRCGRFGYRRMRRRPAEYAWRHRQVVARRACSSSL